MNATRRRVRRKGGGRVRRHRARFKNLTSAHEPVLAPPVPPEQDAGVVDSSLMEDVDQESRATDDDSGVQNNGGEDEPAAKMTITLQTQQIRHAMAEIRKLYADRVAPILSRPLSTVPMTVQEFCYYVVLRTHKSRRVTASTD